MEDLESRLREERAERLPGLRENAQNAPRERAVAGRVAKEALRLAALERPPDECREHVAAELARREGILADQWPLDLHGKRARIDRKAAAGLVEARAWRVARVADLARDVLGANLCGETLGLVADGAGAP